MNKIMPIRLSKSVYCLLDHTNIGIIEDVDYLILVDSGLNSENASEIDKLIQNNFNKKISAIINTHSNADHAGGNKFFSEKYNCKIYATSKEAAFLENPYLESAIIWGAHPFDKIRTSYFECEKSIATDLVNEKSQIKLNNGTIIKFTRTYGLWNLMEKVLSYITMRIGKSTFLCFLKRMHICLLLRNFGQFLNFIRYLNIFPRKHRAIALA